MSQPSHNDYSGHFHGGGNQWVGSTLNSSGGSFHFSAPEQVHNTRYHNTQIESHSQVILGDQYVRTTINTPAFTGTPDNERGGYYGYRSLVPVPTYIERKAIQREIETRLLDRDTQDDQRSSVLVVHGIGGAGKTQVVLNYVQQHRKDYSGVFWVEARSQETLERDFIQIYYLLYNVHQGNGQATIRLDDAVPAVKRWFHRRGRRWLFVFDSVDSIDDERDSSYIDLQRFLLDDPSVHIIITTRYIDAKDISELEPVHVGELEKEEGILLLKKYAHLSNAVAQDDDTILSVVEELGFLALAITLAGSYISKTPRLRADIKRYLPEYQIRRKELLGQRPKQLIHQYGESVLTTWETTLRTLEIQCPEVCRFFTLLSFLQGDDIFIDFNMMKTSSSGFIWTTVITQTRTIDEHDFEEFFSLLQSYSFVNYREHQRSYSVHKLVQMWAYDRLDHVVQREYGHAVVKLLRNTLTNMKSSDPRLKDRLIPHLMASFSKLSVCFRFLNSDDDAVLEYFKIVMSFLAQRGKPKDEKIIGEFVLAKCTSRFGEAHLNTISAMIRLANTLAKLGELPEALLIGREVLAKQRKIFGDEHPHTISAMDDLVNILRETGEIQEALSMQQEVLTKYKRTVGEDHRNTILAMIRLAATLTEVGQLQEALRIGREVVAKQRETIAEEHPHTMLAMGNLANILQETGEVQEALSIQRGVLAKYIEGFGEEHPTTMLVKGNLANILLEAGEVREALSIQRERLVKYREIFGEKHPNTLLTMGSLANILQETGETQEALSIQREVLTNYTEDFGADHPNTILARGNLARILGEAGETREALSIQREVLVNCEDTFGKEHPYTVMIMSNLAKTLIDMGELQESEQMCIQAITKGKKVLGTNHPSFISTVNTLGICYYKQKKLDKAEEMYKQALTWQEKGSGLKRTSHLEPLVNLGMLYSDQGKLVEAQQVYMRAFTCSEKILGLEHASTLRILNSIADLCRDKGTSKQAAMSSISASATERNFLQTDLDSTLAELNKAGRRRMEQGRVTEAKLIFRIVLTVEEKKLDPEHECTKETAIILAQLSKYDDEDPDPSNKQGIDVGGSRASRSN